MIVHAIVDAKREVALSATVHVRNKRMDARELAALARWYSERGHQVVINSRCDVALAVGAAGLHLPSGSIAVSRFRAIVPSGFKIGVSCHSRDELLAAQSEGADYAYLSPVFAPLSKVDARAPLGVEGFARAIEGLIMPVLALGGVTPERFSDCLRAGAAGVAGIALAELEI